MLDLDQASAQEDTDSDDDSESDDNDDDDDHPGSVDELVREAPADLMKGTSVTPAANHLFAVNPDSG
jgi:hypothetical protein